MDKKKKSTAASVLRFIVGALALAAVAVVTIFKLVPYVTELVNKFAARQAKDVLDDEDFDSETENAEEGDDRGI
ncbi:secreted protein [gut metagenome]|uniref:Secreted protein n=1 Tax=gut metagenome TaxID=749906 RepID=J9G5A2_9ZZZZ